VFVGSSTISSALKAARTSSTLVSVSGSDRSPGFASMAVSFRLCPRVRTPPGCAQTQDDETLAVTSVAAPTVRVPTVRVPTDGDAEEHSDGVDRTHLPRARPPGSARREAHQRPRAHD